MDADYAKHDNAHHHGHFDPETMTCGKREEQTRNDEADEVVADPDERTNRNAPNGNRSNLTERQWHMVRTPEFKQWFGDWENDPANASKVIDENGEPKVVYHGTDSEFTTFDVGRSGERSNEDCGMGYISQTITLPRIVMLKKRISLMARECRKKI